MMDLSDCVMLWASPITVTRYYSNNRVRGRSEPPVGRSFEVKMTVEPIIKKESQQAQGDINEGSIEIFGVEKLHTVNTSECKIADEIEYKGEVYEISRIDDWQIIGGYYRYEAVRKTR